MQYLKEEIKMKIMSAALKEFDENGFQKASMMKIAIAADVAIGNIYRYFKNKDELFNSIMEPVFKQITIMVFDHYKESESDSDLKFDVKDVVNTFIEVYMKYCTELLIMMDKSEGSKYQNMKDELIQLVHERQCSEYMPLFKENGIEIQDSFLFVITTTLIEGIFLILKMNKDV